jgi:hypothetical protein
MKEAYTRLTLNLQATYPHERILSYSQLQEIIGEALPPFLYHYPHRFFMNGPQNSYAKIWKEAGYIAKVIPQQKRVFFSPGTALDSSSLPRRVSPRVSRIPLPSPSEVETYLKQWAKLEDYAAQERVLERLFLHSEFTSNDCLDNVLLKCSVLNDFYSTNIFKIYPVACHILSLHIDERLARGDPNLVNDIATVAINGKTKRFYSFASKYCSHHHPAAFPIYDSYVEDVLLYFGRINPALRRQRDDLKDYPTFKVALLAFKAVYGLGAYSLKDLDHYLWLLGKQYFPKRYRKAQGNGDEG